MESHLRSFRDLLDSHEKLEWRQDLSLRCYMFILSDADIGLRTVICVATEMVHWAVHPETIINNQLTKAL